MQVNEFSTKNLKMKERIFYLMLFYSLAAFNGLIAQQQCSLDFSVTTSGGICPDGDVEICITYYPLFTPAECFPPFSDNLWRVYFPTDDFAVVELNQFEQNSLLSNAQVSVIENSDYFVFPDQTTETICFTGQYFTPNTEITINFESPDQSVVFNSQTIKVDDVKVINQDMTVTQAISQGLLLDQSAARITPQSVEIQAVLTVDQDYSFFGSLLMMSSASSEILIPGNVELIVERATNLKGCDNIWSSITVQSGGSLRFEESSLEDADVGMDIQGGGELFTFDAYINSCRTGIRVSDDGSWGMIGIQQFKSYLINCDLGIDLVNTTEMLDIRHWNIWNEGGFSDAFSLGSSTGVRANNCSMVDLNNVTVEGHSGIFLSGIGVDITGGDVFILEDCLFSNNNVGLSADGVGNLTVTSLIPEFSNSRFIGNHIDVKRRSGLNDQTTIEHSVLNRNTYSNIIFDMQPSFAKIQDNMFRDPNITSINNNAWSFFSGPGSNVIVNGLGGGQHRIGINRNDMRSNINNVRLTNTFNATMSKNPIMLSDQTCISVSGGRENNILENSLIGSRSNLTNAINIFSAPIMDIYRNDEISVPGSTTAAGLHFWGACDHSDIECNGLLGNVGLRYNATATTGMQFRKGNRFLTGTNNEPRAIHEGMNPVDDQYVVSDENMGQGSEFYPYYQANSQKWFENRLSSNGCGGTLASDNDSPPTTDDPPPPPPDPPTPPCVPTNSELPCPPNLPGVLSQIARMDMSDLGEESYHKGLRLYRSLAGLQQGCASFCLMTQIEDWAMQNDLSSMEVVDLFPTVLALTESQYDIALIADLEEWYNTVSVLYEPILLYESLSEEMMMDEEDLQVIESLEQDVRSIRKQMRMLEPISFSEAGISDYRTAMAVLSEQLENKYLQITAINNSYQSQSTSIIEDLRSTNDLISSSLHQADDHIRFVNELHLNSLQNEAYSITSADSLKLATLANGCPETLGNVKYEAQSLLLVFTKSSQEFGSECHALENRSRMITAPEDNLLRVWPSPAASVINVENQADSATEFSIYNAGGRVMHYELLKKQQATTLEVSTWPSGIYYLDNHEGTIQKLMVIN